jgi:hypothetical protein
MELSSCNPNCTTPSLASLPSSAIRGRSFGRFDEITDLVEKASALTLARHGESKA